MRIRCSEHPVRACDAPTCTSPGGFFVPLRELQTLNSVPEIYFQKFTVWLSPRDFTHIYARPFDGCTFYMTFCFEFAFVWKLDTIPYKNRPHCKRSTVRPCHFHKLFPNKKSAPKTSKVSRHVSFYQETTWGCFWKIASLKKPIVFR